MRPLAMGIVLTALAAVNFWVFFASDSAPSKVLREASTSRKLPTRTDRKPAPTDARPTRSLGRGVDQRR